MKSKDQVSKGKSTSKTKFKSASTSIEVETEDSKEKSAGSSSSPIKTVTTTRKPRIRISIVEKREKQVSHGWKNIQILTYVVVIVSGIASAKSVGDVMFMFTGQCILGGTLNIKKDVNGTNWITFDNFDTVRWGDMSDCDFCQFFPVASMAVAGSLATFFAMCGRGGDTTRNLPQPWRVVPVAFFFNLIFVIISCVHVAYVYNGFAGFCKHIRPVNEASKVKSCEEVYHASVANVKGDLGANITAAQFFSALGVCGWILSLVVILVRCGTHADFHIVAQRDMSSYRYEKKFDNASYSSSSSNEYSTPLTSIN